MSVLGIRVRVSVHKKCCFYSSEIQVKRSVLVVNFLPFLLRYHPEHGPAQATPHAPARGRQRRRGHTQALATQKLSRARIYFTVLKYRWYFNFYYNG